MSSLHSFDLSRRVRLATCSLFAIAANMGSRPVESNVDQLFQPKPTSSAVCFICRITQRRLTPLRIRSTRGESAWE